MLKELWKGLHFTKSETRVIVFVAMVIVSGYVIRNFRQFIEHASKPYDYSGLDSEFIKRSLNDVTVERFSAVEDSAYIDRQKLAEEIELAGKKIDTTTQEEDAYNGIIVDINSAGKPELEGLPGIGEAMAERIIMFREQSGGFRKTEDLMKVKGIGKKKFDKLKNLITIRKD
jgi:comEA protein